MTRVHPFEKTLGPGPYRYVGMFTINLSNAEKGRPLYNPADKHPNFVRGDGTCAHCGTGILNVYQIQTSTGEVYGVGSDCIHKVDLPHQVLSQVERDKKEHERILRNNRTAAKIAQLREELTGLVKKYGANLASKPHPSFSSKSLKDYAEYALMNGNVEMLKNCILAIRTHEGQGHLEVAAMTDGYCVAIGNTYPFNDKFRQYGFTLKKLGARWVWFREILTDKYQVFKDLAESFGPGIECFFVDELDKVQEAITNSVSTIQKLKNGFHRKWLTVRWFSRVMILMTFLNK